MPLKHLLLQIMLVSVFSAANAQAEYLEQSYPLIGGSWKVCIGDSIAQKTSLIVFKRVTLMDMLYIIFKFHKLRTELKQPITASSAMSMGEILYRPFVWFRIFPFLRIIN
jgi:hypothetical protein